MKKLVLILIAGVSFATAHAQIQFGVKAGANLATVTGSDATGATTMANFNAGVFAKIPFAQSLSFSPEIVYSGQGAKYSYAGVTGSQHLNYLNVPLLVKYTHSSGFSIATGPQIGFLMSAKAKVQGTTQDDKNAYNSTEFAWDFGIGYDIPNTQLGIDLRYDLGISNVENNGNNSGNSTNSTGKLHNSVFQLGLRYTLFGAKK